MGPCQGPGLSNRDLVALLASGVEFWRTQDIVKAFFVGLATEWILCKVGWPDGAAPSAVPAQTVAPAAVQAVANYLQQGVPGNGS
jgi:hypothetical protein